MAAHRVEVEEEVRIADLSCDGTTQQNMFCVMYNVSMYGFVCVYVVCGGGSPRCRSVV